MGRARELAELAASYDSGNIFGMKNRIINGAMVIDQRNNGATISAGDNSFAVDRFAFYHQSGSGSKGNIARNLNSLTSLPAGFTNYYGFQTTSAYSVAAGDGYAINQRIEGFNVADLGFGTANAQTVTLSFWARSSLTGTFGGAARNSADNRSYPFAYTINSANTWEYKTVTIPGDTSGTWTTDNTAGLKIFWGVGVGSTFSGTAGSWAGSAFLSATGATSVVGTNGATFYITGVQLEKGSTATSFDYRPYGTELALCQRYYEKSFDQATKPVENAGTLQGALCTGIYSLSANTALATATFAVEKRASPTITTFNPFAAGSGWSESGGANRIAGVYGVGTRAVTIRCNDTTGTIGSNLSIHWTASIEL